MTLTSSKFVHCSFGSSILELYKMVALAMRKFLASRSSRDTLLRASERIGVSLLMSSLHRPDSYNHKSLFIIQFWMSYSIFLFSDHIILFSFLAKKNMCKAVCVIHKWKIIIWWLDLIFTCCLYMCINTNKFLLNS